MQRLISVASWLFIALLALVFTTTFHCAYSDSNNSEDLKLTCIRLDGAIGLYGLIRCENSEIICYSSTSGFQCTFKR